MSANRTSRVEDGLLIVILLTVAGFAGAASFTHVHDWTLANSPAGTGEWFGWANAVISELTPTAAMLTIRKRRKTGGSVTYPMFLLICSIALSLAAQVAVAKPGLSGWLLSAVPALAFLGLSKLILTTKPARSADPVTPPQPVNPPAPAVDIEQPPAMPAPVKQPEPPARPAVEQPAPAPAPAPVEQPAAVSAPDVPQTLPLFDPAPSAPARVPVSASAFTRHNGVALTRQVTR